ncbi:hypothetical protein CO116_03750 [Candidatus Falkowbacteria bacterium CG_4_9_14_3_um_filter_38_19]|uniref:Mur ligase central domain-containing protein n=2 Tax=Candidatus Falkowiibacteriota TaxID=1752728 RepID=A0A2M6WPF4_9BACT|nr:MAG: hypothetical protein COT96_03005 [Candidatus Falkowbacteria bacterium CG10_big_fil_rev_8_21_14_0_10_38_22]PJB15418.1 MAG: hypothetical protein CO116_03750 [Candidatus Falkowbacteria bacterium CG_4_9_14_3_um_filter_38_19]
MPSFYIIIIFLFWLASALADYVNFCYCWQLKEYRYDRWRDWLSTLSGQKFLASYPLLLRSLICLILFFSLPLASQYIILSLILIFAVDLARQAWLFYRSRLKWPKLTLKSAAIIITALLVEALIYLFLASPNILFLLLICRLFIISLIVLLFKIPTRFIKAIYYKIAANKLKRQKKLIVIGITGSFGKTTVKYFLEQMLAAKFRIIKTPNNINTEIGIAKFILQTDFSQADIFIVEMAAYKIGEIKLICDIVKPQFGILTAINEQHLPLFGNIKNTQAAKYELLYSLPQDGLAIINVDNPYCREFISELKCRVKTFGQLEEFKPDCLIKNISPGAESLKFQAAPNYEIKTNIIGAHNAVNIAPVILAANDLGFIREEIEAQAKKFQLPQATMQLVNYGRSIIIDDSYNANPAGFTAGLKFLADYKVSGKKIVISRGMIELGQAAPQAHLKIGRLIAEVADEFIIISPDSVAELKAGADNSNLIIQTILNPTKLLQYLKKNKNQPNVILLEGRMPDNIKHEIY